MEVDCKETDSFKTENEPPDKNRKFGIRVVMCLCAFMELVGESMIMPYFPRAMDITRGKNTKKLSNLNFIICITHVTFLVYSCHITQ